MRIPPQSLRERKTITVDASSCTRYRKQQILTFGTSEESGMLSSLEQVVDDLIPRGWDGRERPC